MFTLETIRQRLAQHSPAHAKAKPSTRQAAVAVILREWSDGPQLLFIKRAEKPGDPWSGHMAFPGGHLDPTDHTLHAAAMRETHEEIALDLSNANYLGSLDHQQASPRGRVLDMLIAPHVFEIDGDPAFRPNYEVEEVVWSNLHSLTNNSLHDTETKPMAGTPTVFNGYRLSQRHFVWGLTYRMLKTFFTTIDPDWQGPREL